MYLGQVLKLIIVAEYLFSYGTLQLEKVQLESFGRKLIGSKEVLKGFKLEKLLITNKDVIKKSQQTHHPIAIPTGNNKDNITGMLYKITAEELRKADIYEVSDYKRIKVKFESSKTGWVYVRA